MSSHTYCAINPHFLLQTAGDDMDLFRELSAMFLRLAGPVHARLELAIKSGDNNAAHFESHALKGSTGLVGAVALTTLLSEIETHAHRQRNDLVTLCLPELTRLFALAMAEVSFSLDHFNGPSTIDTTPDTPR